MNARTLAPALALAGVSLLAVVGAAAADGSKGPHAAAPTASRPPKGFTVVKSGPVVAVSGQQTRGVVACPAGLVPLGGGVSIVSLSTNANVNSSFPRDNGWVADVNNASGATTTFEVRVVCVQRPTNYSVVIGNGVSNPSAS